MRLIDADNLLKALKNEKIETNEIIGKARKLERMLCIQYINTEPTVNERPQGEWIIKTGVVSNYSACSLCDFADYRHLHFNYCPDAVRGCRSEENCAEVNHDDRIDNTL